MIRKCNSSEAVCGNTVYVSESRGNVPYEAVIISHGVIATSRVNSLKINVVISVLGLSMEIYHEYKERMRMEPNFEAFEVEEAKQIEPDEIQAEQTETIEKVEREIIDQSGNVVKTVSTAAFPQALEQVEALVLYLQGCFVIILFQPFLQMVEKSELPKADKLHFFNRTVNHYGGGDTHDAYHNNAYGLIEYICNSDTFMVAHKNRQGERKRASVTYDQICSVMEYLIRAGLFTDNVRMEKYTKDFTEKPYDRLDSLEKQFSNKL